MLLHLRRLTCKNVDTLFLNTCRPYANAVASPRRKEKKHGDGDAAAKRGETPIITCRKAIYNFYKGDPYTRNKQAHASHGWKNRSTRGDYFVIHPYHADETEASSETFRDFDLHPAVCDAVESKLDIHKPLEIQKLGIPQILLGHNVLLAAETGCGKTLAYLLPLATKVSKWKEVVQRNMNAPLGLIVTPSRELAVQIALQLIKVSKPLGIRTKMITGGRTKRLIRDPPASHVDVLVCSFGVVSKLSTLGVYDLRYVRFVVLDEADSLFHITFEEKLRVFMRRLSIGYYQEERENELPDSSQLVLTSATIPARLEDVLDGIVNPSSLQRMTTKKLHTILVPQKFVRLLPSQKPAELLKYIRPKALSKQRVIVFCNRNSTSYWLAMFLNECGIKVTNLNGDMPLHVRRGRFGEFINGKTMVLSTTNGGSRGLDTVMVNHVLNYDFPTDTSDYIHRCGRTGRVGTVGDSRVTNFISRPGEVEIVQRIEAAARRMKPIPIFNIFEWPDNEEVQDEYVENVIEDLDSVENIPY